MKEAGLDHIQLSFQDSTRELNDFVSSTKTFELKHRVARLIKAHGYPMVLNCVLHRYNLPHVGQIIDMALEMGADYLELANTQYYGWAMLNRDQLMPTSEQLQEAEATVNRYRERVGDRCRILFVVPDYFEVRPKACMNGWGSVFLGIAPDGTALPCHAARSLPGLDLPHVQDASLRGNLVRQPRVQCVSWRWLDARAVPELRRARNRSWRLPLPGISADRRRRGCGPGVRKVGASRADRAGGDAGAAACT